MPQTPHIERHFTGSERVKDIVIGMADGLTVPFALAAGLSGACDLSWVSKSPIPGERLPVQERLQELTSHAALSRSVRTWFSPGPAPRLQCRRSPHLSPWVVLVTSRAALPERHRYVAQSKRCSLAGWLRQ